MTQISEKTLMTAERRSVVVGMLFINSVKRSGADLRNVVARAEEAGVPVYDFIQLMKVGMAYAFNELAEGDSGPVVDPWSVTTQTHQEICVIAERVADNAMQNGKPNFIDEFEKLLRRPQRAKSGRSQMRITELFKEMAEFGITTDELFEVIQDAFRRLDEIKLSQVRQMVIAGFDESTKS